MRWGVGCGRRFGETNLVEVGKVKEEEEVGLTCSRPPAAKKTRTRGRRVDPNPEPDHCERDRDHSQVHVHVRRRVAMSFYLINLSAT